ncbi:tetratricopeptide repeat protein [Thalassotalea aquiviva]|uniref:tetratricopeptide repeat protein n=1 Tax=Thalassotalea aquiviva TaxID=3242415 RepID=UPI00352B086A
MYINRLVAIIALCSCFFVNAATNSIQDQIQLLHPSFEKPLSFNVSLPSGYANNKKKSYILMFDFHPNADTYLRGMHDWMSHNGEWPWLQTIIVTPAQGNRVGMLFDSSGKTTPLLDFFETQLLPEIDSKYRTNGFRIMSGFRSNGTLVLSTLINKPEMFDAYIAISPELQDDYAGILSTAQSKLEKVKNTPKFLLFSHGTNIKEEHQLQSYGQLQALLSNHAPESLDWHYKHYEEYYFMSLPLVSVITGIEKLFDDINDGLPPESAISQQGVDSIVRHYNYLSKQKYGFEVSPKTSINNLGFYLLENLPEKGIRVFKEMVKRYPTDAYSHHNLARAYAEIGDYDTAVKYQSHAVKIADNMLTWHQKRHRRFLEEYTAKANNTKSTKSLHTQ